LDLALNHARGRHENGTAPRHLFWFIGLITRRIEQIVTNGTTFVAGKVEAPRYIAPAVLPATCARRAKRL
jgi:hypothetical protein